MAISVIMFICGVGGYLCLQSKASEWHEVAYWLFLISNTILAGTLYVGEEWIAMSMIIVYIGFCGWGIFKSSRDDAVSSHHENNDHRTDVFINADRSSIPKKYRDRFSKY